MNTLSTFCAVFLIAFLVTFIMGWLIGFHKDGYGFLVGLASGVALGNSVMHTFVFPMIK